MFAFSESVAIALGAFSSPALLSHPELVPMTSGHCSALLPSMGVLPFLQVVVIFLRFELNENVLYRVCPQARSRVDLFFYMVMIKDKATLACLCGAAKKVHNMCACAQSMTKHAVKISRNRV